MTLPYRDPSLPQPRRLADLLTRMTLAEKLAQLTCRWRWMPLMIGSGGAIVDEAARRLLGQGLGTLSRLREDLEPGPSASAANAVQRWVLEHTRLGIPVLFHGEGLHGDMEQGGTSFPQPLAMASSWDPELIHRVFTAVACEMRIRGGHLALGPNLDLGRDPRWGRIEETYGEDPLLVARLGVACIRALQGAGADGDIDDRHVLATAKHFAAHGQPEAGTNIGPVNIALDSLRHLHLAPFAAAIREAKVAAVMPAYHEINGLPCHANRWLLQTVLRDELGFTGLVLSDYFGILQLAERHRVASDFPDAAGLALLAGVDLETPEPFIYHYLKSAVAEGRIGIEPIDRAVERVLAAKFRLGLFERPFVEPAQAATVVGCQPHRELAVEAALRSLVLLKNAGDLLPLDPQTIGRLAVIGPNAAGVHLGGYSDRPSHGVSILAGLEARLGSERVAYAKGCTITREGGDWFADTATLADPAEDDRDIAAAVELARSCDAVVVVVGGNEDTNREGWHEDHLGDRDSIALIGRQEDLVHALLDTGRPVVVVLIHSGPLAIPSLAERAPAILDAFYPGQEGGTAIAAVLCGDHAPSGKLAITYPRSTGQIPAAYNHKPTARRGYLFASAEPLFPFGHGLTYTSFALEAPTVAPGVVAQDGVVTLRAVLRNTGARAGTEVVQLYLRAAPGLATRPVCELRDFARVTLAPGTSTTVTFTIPVSAFAPLGAVLGSAPPLPPEPGRYTLLVGTNSRDTSGVEVEVTGAARSWNERLAAQEGLCR